MEDMIATIIRNWLQKEFGNPDAIPNLVIMGLSKEICEHGWEIYHAMQNEYDGEDIDYAANSHGIELDEKEKEYVMGLYQKEKEYNSASDMLGEFMERVIEYRKIKDSLSSLSSSGDGGKND